MGFSCFAYIFDHFDPVFEHKVEVLLNALWKTAQAECSLLNCMMQDFSIFSSVHQMSGYTPEVARRP